MVFNNPRLWLIGIICLLFVSAARAEAPQALPRPRLPRDQRLGPLKDHYDMVGYADSVQLVPTGRASAR